MTKHQVKQKRAPTFTEIDVHYMTTHDDTGHRNSSVEDQMILVGVVNNSSLPPRARNSLSPSNTVSLHVVPENKRDLKEMKANHAEQQAPPTYVNFKSHFFQKKLKNKKRLEVVRRILCRTYINGTCNVIYQQAVVREEFMKYISRTLHQNIMQGHPGSKKMLYTLRKCY